MITGDPLLELREFTAAVGQRTIVHPLSVTLEAGGCLALVGESGCGKTTTGLALLGERGAAVRTGGSIIVAGSPVRPTSQPMSAPGVGYVPQHPGAVLTPTRTVGAYLRDVARTRLDPDEELRLALARSRLGQGENLLRRFPHQLSGGQQQRVALAAALIGSPGLLVADEPTTGQDPAIRLEITAKLEELLEAGLGLVLLSHDLDLVRRLASTTVVLRHGRVVERGPDVWSKPQSAYARRLLAAQGDLKPDDAPAPSKGAGGACPPVLSVTGLSARHGRRGPVVLQDIAFDLAAGECLAVVGASGAGKTTLGRTVVGLHHRSAGSVLLAGRPLAPRVRQRQLGDLADCQYVFQDAQASMDPYRPVVEQVARAGVRLRGLSADKASEEAALLLGEVGVPGLDRERSTALSGGELQRVSLARALIARPRVLICDEVTSGLDVMTRDEVLALLDHLRVARGLALLLITHEEAVVARLADRVLPLDHGRQGPITTQPSMTRVSRQWMHDTPTRGAHY